MYDDVEGVAFAFQILSATGKPVFATDSAPKLMTCTSYDPFNGQPVEAQNALYNPVVASHLATHHVGNAYQETIMQAEVTPQGMKDKKESSLV